VHQRPQVELIQSCGHCQKTESRSAISTTTETCEPFVTVAIDSFGPLKSWPSLCLRYRLVLHLIRRTRSVYRNNTAQSAAQRKLFSRFLADVVQPSTCVAITLPTPAMSWLPSDTYSTFQQTSRYPTDLCQMALCNARTW
jgi:hypothetical protein